MRALTSGLTFTLHLLSMTAVATAGSLQVSPVNIQVQAPVAASTVTLQNLGKDRVNAQVRIFEWKQVNGKDELVPTRSVVASPPALKMAAGKKSVIRIVRTDKAPLQGEENYRLMIDEIPTLKDLRLDGCQFCSALLLARFLFSTRNRVRIVLVCPPFKRSACSARQK